MVANYVEQLAAEDGSESRAAARFEGATESGTAFAAAAGEPWAALLAASRREDILMTCKYSATRALGGSEPGCFATTSQLAFRSDGVDEREGAMPQKIQDCLWSGSKFVDSKVPRSVPASSLAMARRQQLAADQARGAYTTVEKVRHAPAKLSLTPPLVSFFSTLHVLSAAIRPR